MEIHFAPLQGYVDNTYRHEHNRLAGGIDCYYTPFIRMEKGGPRSKDIERLASPLNDNLPLVPQIIFRNTDELKTLCDAVSSAGYNRIDLNLGCPFPMQTSRGCGAALVLKPDVLAEVSRTLRQYGNITFSLKMRLGLKQPDEWAGIIDIINGSPLSHVTVHPRVARQLYKGELYLDEFERIYERCSHPLIYNGDIKTVGDIRAIENRFPDIKGVMAGRGLLSDPALAIEYKENRELSAKQRLELILRLHDAVYTQYRSTLCGDCQILSKIKPFWDYSESNIGHKGFKLIKKASTLSKYNEAIAVIKNSLYQPSEG